VIFDTGRTKQCGNILSFFFRHGIAEIVADLPFFILPSLKTASQLFLALLDEYIFN